MYSRFGNGSAADAQLLHNRLREYIIIGAGSVSRSSRSYIAPPDPGTGDPGGRQ